MNVCKSKNIVKLKDNRTGKNYAVQADLEHYDYALKKLQEKMDYDYFESLPAGQRIEKKVKSLDFTCPYCIEKTEVSSRKEKIVTSFLFWSFTTIINIFKCHKCWKEFTEQEIYTEKEVVRRKNNVITNFENWKDAKKEGKNPPEFMSLDKIDEVIINEFK